MNRVTEQNKEAYLRLRKAVGILGMSLPIALFLGGGFFDGIWGQTSISEYHYSAMRDYFDAALGTIGLFLAYYPGYDCGDTIARWLSSVGAWGVVIIYTTADQVVPCTGLCSIHRDICFINTLLADGNRAHVHLVFATMFFVGLTLFCFLFRKSSNQSINEFIKNMARFDWVRWMFQPSFGLAIENGEITDREKLTKNSWFLICGWGMVICLGVIFFMHMLSLQSQYGVFIFESLGVFLFGFAWFIKGEGHLWICKLLCG